MADEIRGEATNIATHGTEVLGDISLHEDGPVVVRAVGGVGFGWPAIFSSVMLITLLLGMAFTSPDYRGTVVYAILHPFSPGKPVEPPPAPVFHGNALVVATNPADRLTASLTLEPRGYTAIFADSVAEGLERLKSSPVKIAVIDDKLPGSTEMARQLGQSLPADHVIVLREPRKPESLPQMLLAIL